ncbi:hypothetical protein NHX12_015469 [Muraenolepis orangiensis]|uniref:Serine/threonine-protein kinase haspin C-terminal domain-containing protein n=1 Tax=Muraenolepis orangiensis TaxID=630683 RepID=A0A9Q0D954_9TELE|nr:hypothetical protein NHX12_015469 [Muraenolepis orangiensis]
MRQANSNEWSGYQPHSNVLWIHYLSDKLCSMKFRRSAGMRKIKAALTRFHNAPRSVGADCRALPSRCCSWLDADRCFAAELRNFRQDDNAYSARCFTGTGVLCPAGPEDGTSAWAAESP